MFVLSPPRSCPDRRTVNSRSMETPVANIGEVAGYGGGGGHFGADQVGASPSPLASFKITIAGRSAALAGAQDVGIHSQAHRAARLAPLEAGFLENPVQALAFGSLLHFLRTGNDHSAHAGGDPVAFGNPRGGPQIFQARIGAGADENPL